MYAVLFKSSRLVAEQQNMLRGTFATPPIFSPNGQALTVLQGGTVDQLMASAKAAGAQGVWTQDGLGLFQLLVIDGPTFVQTSFRAAFLSGFAAPTAVLLAK
jgi:hypothetical protein